LEDSPSVGNQAGSPDEQQTSKSSGGCAVGGGNPLNVGWLWCLLFFPWLYGSRRTSLR
jgi:hypothetical protein